MSINCLRVLLAGLVLSAPLSGGVATATWASASEATARRATRDAEWHAIRVLLERHAKYGDGSEVDAVRQVAMRRGLDAEFLRLDRASEWMLERLGADLAGAPPSQRKPIFLQAHEMGLAASELVDVAMSKNPGLRGRQAVTAALDALESGAPARDLETAASTLRAALLDRSQIERLLAVGDDAGAGTENRILALTALGPEAWATLADRLAAYAATRAGDVEFRNACLSLLRDQRFRFLSPEAAPKLADVVLDERMPRATREEAASLMASALFPDAVLMPELERIILAARDDTPLAEVLGEVTFELVPSEDAVRQRVESLALDPNRSPEGRGAALTCLGRNLGPAEVLPIHLAVLKGNGGDWLRRAQLDHLETRVVLSGWDLGPAVEEEARRLSVKATNPEVRAAARSLLAALQGLE